MDVSFRRHNLDYRTLARPVLVVVLVSLALSAGRRCYRVMSQEAAPVRLAQAKMGLKLAWSSISEIEEALKRGQITSEELIKTFDARIGEVNSKVHAVSVINPEALEIARASDKLRVAGESRGVLEGMPIMVKDVFLTQDNMPSTAGCSGLRDAKPSFEATVIKKLRQKGAIIHGKTVPSQWANYRSPGNAPNGWSAVGGQCMGIYSDEQDPGGSSAGSAVAVALGLVPAALGTETSGSIASPARSAGIVGLKPTSSLTSRHGVYCVSELQDSVGVLAKTVEDAAIVLTAIAGYDPEDPLADGHPVDGKDTVRPSEDTDFQLACKDDALRGMRIAVPRHVMNRDGYAMEKFDEALRVMQSLGAIIVDNVAFSEWNLSYSKKANWKHSLRVGARASMEKFLQGFETNPHELHTLSDVMAYTSETPEEENEMWGMSEWDADEEAARAYGPDTEGYQESVALRLRISGQVKELLDRENCDVIAAPWWTDTTAPVAGCPQVSVPLQAYPKEWAARRLVKGLITTGPNIPTGIIFVGRRWDDFKVIGAAHSFEKATQHRRSFKPVIVAKTELSQNHAMI